MAKYRLPQLPRHGGYTGRPKKHPGDRGYRLQEDKVQEALQGAGAYKMKRLYENFKDKKWVGVAAGLATAAYNNRAHARRLINLVRTAQQARANRLNQEAIWDQTSTPPKRRLNFGHIQPPRIKPKTRKVPFETQWEKRVYPQGRNDMPWR